MLWLSKQIKKPLGLFWFCLPLILIEFTLEPYFPKTHALVGDWYLLTKFSVLFGYGFILIHLKDVFWKSLESYRKLYATIAVLAFSVLYVSVWIMKDTHFSYALELIIVPINYWSWILTFFGFAAKYLNKTSEKLRYANEAVYPFYILQPEHSQKCVNVENKELSIKQCTDDNTIRFTGNFVNKNCSV